MNTSQAERLAWYQYRHPLSNRQPKKNVEYVYVNADVIIWTYGEISSLTRERLQLKRIAPSLAICLHFCLMRGVSSIEKVGNTLGSRKARWMATIAVHTAGSCPADMQRTHYLAV